MNSNKKKTHNKDALRREKYEKKKKHIKSVASSKRKSLKRKDNEKYMREERNYNKYFMKNIVQENYMYKIKDFIVDWFNKHATISDDDFWHYLTRNENAVFMFFDNKHYRIVTSDSYYCNMIENKNSGIIAELFLDKLLMNISDDSPLWLWDVICMNSNKNMLRMLDDNVEKYKSSYGEYYPLLYGALCRNDNADHMIKKYYDTMFEFNIEDYPMFNIGLGFSRGKCDYLQKLCENKNKEVLSFIEPYLKIIENDDRLWQCFSGLMCNPSAIHLIEKVDDYDCSELFYNENAVHLIKKIYGDNLEDLHDDQDWIHLIGNPSAIHLLEKHIPEKKELDYFVPLACNPNGIALFEKLYNEDKIWCLNPEYSFKVDYSKHTNIDPRIPLNQKTILKRLLENPNSIGFFERNPTLLRNEILKNPSIFEVNYEYLRKKLGYVTHEEEDLIIKYRNNELETLEPKLLKKAHGDYITQQEVEDIVTNYQQKGKYLSEHELIMQLSKRRLMEAVFSPKRVLYNLEKYNYNIGTEEYCEED